MGFLGLHCTTMELTAQFDQGGKGIKRFPIHFSVNQKPRPLEHDQVKEIKSELVTMRDKINTLLVRLDMFSDDREFHTQPEAREQVSQREPTQGNLSIFIPFFIQILVRNFNCGMADLQMNRQ